ncbi:hypothetical protein D5018_11700 [Parashewanella curva]|uniref:Uncharacterized protein n=1 Tax=Parashewanella curva TaxID=2338552 RepID=A0A3L8PVR6_9GAMM|nr:hypothetical protein [Parashewanella curva]RLV59527.1 hypothetical protein D5018_11700 [Parashewanella curva]
MTVAGGIFQTSEQRNVYTLELNSTAQNSFKELQQFLAKHQNVDINIRVVPKLQSYPNDASYIKMWVDLQLSSQDGYFRLIDGAELSLEQLKQSKNKDGS